MNYRFYGTGQHDDVLLAIAGSFAAVIALVFAAAVAPVSQPRAVIWGHMICCSVAVFVDYFTDTITHRHVTVWPIVPQWLANALVPTLGTVIMSYTGSTSLLMLY